MKAALSCVSDAPALAACIAAHLSMQYSFQSAGLLASLVLGDGELAQASLCPLWNAVVCRSI